MDQITVADWLGYGGVLLQGIWVTVILTVAGCAVAITVAFIVGLGRISRFWLVRTASSVFIEFFRGTSVFVQLFWAYFVLPLLGLSLPALLTGILVLGFNVGAYGGEVVRGAILAVPKEQHEACIAVNLSRWQSFRWVIIPQAIIRMLPTLNNLSIELLKGTSVASLITIADMTFQAQLIRTATGTTALPFISILTIYFLMGLVITFGFRKLEARLSEGLDVVRG